jgi:hypothetical protein
MMPNPDMQQKPSPADLRQMPAPKISKLARMGTAMKNVVRHPIKTWKGMTTEHKAVAISIIVGGVLGAKASQAWNAAPYPEDNTSILMFKFNTYFTPIKYTFGSAALVIAGLGYLGVEKIEKALEVRAGKAVDRELASRTFEEIFNIRKLLSDEYSLRITAGTGLIGLATYLFGAAALAANIPVMLVGAAFLAAGAVLTAYNTKLRTAVLEWAGKFDGLETLEWNAKPKGPESG